MKYRIMVPSQTREGKVWSTVTIAESMIESWIAESRWFGAVSIPETEYVQFCACHKVI